MSASPRVYGGPWGRRELLLVGSILLLAASLRVTLASSDHSIFYPDEIHQSLEQGHRLAFGYGLVPWEFRRGARSWLFPGLIAATLKLADLLGVQSALGLVIAARLMMVTLALLALLLTILLARRLAGPRAGLLAGAMGAVLPISLVFSHRTMAEVASTPLLLLSALMLLYEGRTRMWIAAGAVTVATFLRFQNGLIALVFIGALLVAKRWRDARHFVNAASIVVVLGGVLDMLTWGKAYGSVLRYLEANVVRGVAAAMGTEPFYFYGQVLYTATGAASIVILVGAVVGASRARGLAAATLVFFLVHSFVGHKELRFLTPILPFIVVLAAVGLLRLAERTRHQRALIALSAACLVSLLALHARGLTNAQMGKVKGPTAAGAPVWYTGQEVQLLLAEAGRRDDLCGLAVIGVRWHWTGGYSYLHRDVPLLWHYGPVRGGKVNYVLVKDWQRRRLPPAYGAVKMLGPYALFRRPGICAPSKPGYHLK